MSVNSITTYAASGTPAPSPARAPQAAQAGNPPEPKMDVIDLTKPPTPEQAERLRKAGILGYGSFRMTGTSSGIGPGTAFSVDYSYEYFDVTTETVTRHASSTKGVLRENGFSAVSESLTVQTTFDEERYWRGQLGDIAGKMAAARQVKESYLDAHFSGQERQDRLKKLDGSYQAAKGEAVDSFTKMLGKFLKQEERGRFEKNVRRSVEAVFSRYEASYQAAAAKREFGAWASASFYESTLTLQKMSGPAAAGADRGAWPLEELDFAAVSVSAYHASLSAVQKGGGEGRHALQFSMTSMKVEVMAARGLIHQDLADLLRLSGRNARRGGLFGQVVDRVMDQYGKTGDAMEAIRAGAALGGVPLDAKGYQSSFEVEWRRFTAQFESQRGSLSLLG